VAETEHKGNQNCLEGLRCPSCGSYEPFWISCITLALFYDDGVDRCFDYDWNEDSTCSCTSCEFSGTVRDFRVPKKEKP
jgi:hypothetical protein